MMQDVVYAVSIVGMGALAAVFGWVAVGANNALVDYGPAIATAYRMRTWLFGLAVLILIACNYKTLGELPYVRTLSAAPSATLQPVEVAAEQWSWTITPSAFRVGQTAEFHVMSKDVNHGFALYGPDMRIVAQTQAMPGYINVLRYTFTEPGTYHVMCLEYCGVAHHAMTADITVAAH